MLWWFEREGRKVRMEVLLLSAGGYELRIIGVDGVEHVEHFTDAAELAKRQLEIQDELISKGWSRSSCWIV
jgi:hypothetical protein